MTIVVEFAPTKEEILKKGDEECEDIAKKLRETGEVYIDPDFPPNGTSIGVLLSGTGEITLQKSDEPWLQPKEFIKSSSSRGGCVDEWKVWDDPQPFHVTQGAVGNCGLIATLMAVAWKKGLVEQIIPKRDYTMDCGIVQVRLLVNGEWKVIKTDFHIPQVDGRELFTVMTKRQCWVAFLEKAFAKVKGSYGQLHSFCPTEAFTCLTGYPTKIIYINSETNCDGLWEDLVKHNSFGYLLAAATPKIEEGSEEEKKYKDVNLFSQHGYAILGFKEHDGHRLLRVGHGGRRQRFTGKWSHLHAYENEFLESRHSLDREISNWGTSWIDIEEFRRLFLCYYVCEYREGFTALRFKEIVRRKKGDDMQILRLEIQKHCELKIDIKVFENGNPYMYNLFLNIHKCSEDNQCGELLFSFNAYYFQLQSDTVSFSPGVYLLVFVCFDDNLCMENEWTIWSSTSLDKSQIQFISCPFSVHYRSLTDVISKYGEAEKIEQDQIVVYKWRGKYNCIFMVDNLRESEYVYVKCKITSGNEEEPWSCLSFCTNYWHPVPPMSRSIVGVVASRKYEPIIVSVDVQYSINYLYFKWINHIDAWRSRDHLENFTLLEFEN